MLNTNQSDAKMQTMNIIDTNTNGNTSSYIMSDLNDKVKEIIVNPINFWSDALLKLQMGIIFDLLNASCNGIIDRNSLRISYFYAIENVKKQGQSNYIDLWLSFISMI